MLTYLTNQLTLHSQVTMTAVPQDQLNLVIHGQHNGGGNNDHCNTDSGPYNQSGPGPSRFWNR